MPRAVVAAAVLTVCSLGWGGCGDGEDGRRTSSGIAVSGETRRDIQIGLDLRAYINRNCSVQGSRAEFRNSIERAEEPPPEAIKRYLARRYGSVDRAYQSFRYVCEGYRRINVKDGVITVRTTLAGDRLGRVGAADICDVIQGSDVADFTPGHTVHGADGAVLKVCPTRRS